MSTTSSTAVSIPEEETHAAGSNSPAVDVVQTTQAIEMMDLADLTDNISVASAAEAAGSNTSESNHLSSNLLKLETKGLIGLFERLPLVLKIFLLVLFSTVGLLILSGLALALSATVLNTTRATSNYIAQEKLITEVLHALQKERRVCRMMLQGTDTALQVMYLQTIPETESAISNMNQVLSAKKELYGEAYTNFVAKRSAIDSLRAKTTARMTTVDQMLTSYHDIIQSVLILIHRGIAVLGYDFNASALGTYSEYNEDTRVLMTIGTIVLQDPSYRNELMPLLLRFVGERDAMERVLVESGPRESVAKFQSLIVDSQYNKDSIAMTSEIMTRTGNYSFSLAQYSNALLGLSLLLEEVGDNLFATDIKMTSDSKSTHAIGIIVVVVASVVFFGVTAITNAILFSRSIIGPWQRMNALQESTISKFVPKGFLSLMGWKSIAQAKLGKWEEKEVTILIVSIANFSKLQLAMNEQPNQIYDFVNTYLAYVGPFVRSNSGYIDKFNSDHFVAIFQKDKRAIKAALEIQQSISNFNKMQMAFGVAVRISLVTGKTTLGTIGENERMESTLISSVMKKAIKLQKLAKRVNAAILTTKETLSSLNPRAIHHRYIGNVKLRSELLGSCDLFEILSFAEPVKIKTKDHFTKAVRCLHANRLQDALALFESIAQANPSDILAAKYRELTRQCIMENVKRLTEMSASQVLLTPELRVLFEQISEQEHSMENINLWDQIQMFKECQSPEDRRLVASRICDEFLQLDGKQAVNLSEEQVSSVRRIVQNTSISLSPLLFVEIESWVEHVMSDTIKRLKSMPQFKLDFLNSSLAFKLEEIDVLEKSL